MSERVVLCENFAKWRGLRTLLIFSLLVIANPYPNAAAFFLPSIMFLQGFETVIWCISRFV